MVHAPGRQLAAVCVHCYNSAAEAECVPGALAILRCRCRHAGCFRACAQQPSKQGDDGQALVITEARRYRPEPSAA